MAGLQLRTSSPLQLGLPRFFHHHFHPPFSLLLHSLPQPTCPPTFKILRVRLSFSSLPPSLSSLLSSFSSLLFMHLHSFIHNLPSNHRHSLLFIITNHHESPQTPLHASPQITHASQQTLPGGRQGDSFIERQVDWHGLPSSHCQRLRR